MKKRLVMLSILTACAVTVAPAIRAEENRSEAASAGDRAVDVAGDAPVHIHLTRDAAEAAAAATRASLARVRRSANMTYHGGKIMTSATVKSIFWGPKWSGATFTGDKVTGIDSFYAGFNQSHYALTSDEYTGLGQQVGPTVLSLSHQIDTSTASGGNSTAAILAEACKWFTGPTDGSAYYAVYTDLPRGNAGYCAYHSVGTCGGVPVQFAFFWSLDGDPGCDPGSTVSGHSQGLAALANVSAHELSEARSDPANPGAWYDSSGQENGDKCAWSFNVPSVTFSNGSAWKLQGEWSNAAFTAGTGYPNLSGQRGCLDGH
jgi:hypothetical protein